MDERVVTFRVPDTHFGYVLRCENCGEAYSFITPMVFCTEEDTGDPTQGCYPSLVCPNCIEEGGWVPFYPPAEEAQDE